MAYGLSVAAPQLYSAKIWQSILVCHYTRTAKIFTPRLQLWDIRGTRARATTKIYAEKRAIGGSCEFQRSLDSKK